MVYFAFFVSALVTGALFAMAARLVVGIEHAGVLFAIGFIGAGLQMLVLMIWYLRHTRPKQTSAERREEPR